MPVLKNTRHELYAQALAEGKTASEAIGLAGYSPDPRNTTPLTNHPDIRRRVDELLQMKSARSQRKAEYSTQWIIERLMLNADDAAKLEDYSASNAALRLLGMEKGMFRERIESGAVGDFEQAQSLEEIVNSVSELVSPQAAQALAKAFGLELDPQALLEAESPSDSVN